jgi:hypothetical protein
MANLKNHKNDAFLNRIISYFPMCYILILVCLVVLIILIWNTVILSTHNIFIAALGFLTFISIFFGFTVNTSTRFFDIAREYIYKESTKKAKNKLDKINIKDDKITDKLNEIQTELHDADTLRNYLKLDIFLFVAIMAYFFSILVYFFPIVPIFSGIQVVLFFIGVWATLVLILGWFISSQLILKIRKKGQ